MPDFYLAAFLFQLYRRTAISITSTQKTKPVTSTTTKLQAYDYRVIDNQIPKFVPTELKVVFWDLDHGFMTDIGRKILTEMYFINLVSLT